MKNVLMVLALSLLGNSVAALALAEDGHFDSSSDTRWEMSLSDQYNNGWLRISGTGARAFYSSLKVTPVSSTHGEGDITRRTKTGKHVQCTETTLESQTRSYYCDLQIEDLARGVLRSLN